MADQVTVNFNRDDIGKATHVFSFALTGQGKPGVWIVRRADATHRNVLVQTERDRTDYQTRFGDGFDHLTIVGR
jgi:hypothetical protein